MEPVKDLCTPQEASWLVQGAARVSFRAMLRFNLSRLGTLIGPVETYAALIARAVWHKLLTGQTYLQLIDNVCSEDCYVRDTSESDIIRGFLVASEMEFNGTSWSSSHPGTFLMALSRSLQQSGTHACVRCQASRSVTFCHKFQKVAREV